MSLKQEIETWLTALAAYDSNEFDVAIKCFERIADTSKIWFNLGVINATLGEHTQAVHCYMQAVKLDQFLAIAWFQAGVSHFLLGAFEEALGNFNQALACLRGNKHIDYLQLGLKFQLYSCETLFNRGLCYIYLQQKEAGTQDLAFAAREKVVPEHDVIDEAIREEAEGYTVFSIPVGVVYRPSAAKVKNLKQKDYMGKARLVAAQEHFEAPRLQAAMAKLSLDARPPDQLSYAALNLVRPDLRSRQQSEPPQRRNVFPPTPPPEELERPESTHGREQQQPQPRTRRRSVESTASAERSTALLQARPAAKALRLDLGAAAFDYHKAPSPDKVRFGSKRSESERPPARRGSLSTRAQDARGYDYRSSGGGGAGVVRIEEDPIVAYSQRATQAQAPNSALSPSSSYSHQRSRSSVQRLQPLTIEEEGPEGEEDEAAEEAEEGSPNTPLAFEIVAPPVPARSQSRRAPEVRKVRIKVHAEDMRYVLTSPTVGFDELREQIRAKFGVAGAFKLKFADDEGDMVTMGDQEDLDMAMGICRAAAAKERLDMGKMEVWLQEI